MMIEDSAAIRAWHFVGATLRDGRPIPADGEWLEHRGSLVMCELGLHASRQPFDALQYAPGATLCLVDVSGTIVERDDKLVATRRRIIKRIDVTTLLRHFACQQALSVVHLWDAPEIVVRYLKTEDESLRGAAREAAREAARGAAWGAAWEAAREAARGAAWEAAWEAAAWEAAWGIAWGAAWEAAWEAAAWEAAWEAARVSFNTLIETAFQ